MNSLICSSWSAPRRTSPRTRSKRVARVLQVGHAHRVLVAHPQRQVPRGLGCQRVVAVRGQRLHAVEVGVRVGRILVVDQPTQAFGQHRLVRRRELAVQALQQRLHLRVRMRGGRRLRRGDGRCRVGRRLASGPRRAFGKGRQTGLDAHAAAADGVLEGLTAEGQHAAAAQRAEQHGADHAAVPPADVLQVEAHEAPGGRFAGGFDLRGIGTPSAIAVFRRWRTRGGWRRSASCGRASPAHAARRGRLPSARTPAARPRRPAWGSAPARARRPRLRPQRAGTAPGSRSWRRCAARRRPRTWSARCTRPARPSTIQSASTPPPSPPMASTAILIGCGLVSMFFRRPPPPAGARGALQCSMTPWRRPASRRSQRVGLLTSPAR